jgi:hypothetical protein
MHIQHLLKITGLMSLSLLLCNVVLPAQANTTRDSSGMNMGSEVVGGLRPDRTSDPNILSPAQQATSTIATATANRAIVGAKQGDRTFAFPTQNGMATVTYLPTIGSDRSTRVTLNSPNADGRFSRQQFTVANSVTGAELTGLFVLMDRMIELGKKPNRDDLKTMLAMYNNFVKNSSPEVLVILSNLPEFQAIRTQLTSLRNIASQP